MIAKISAWNTFKWSKKECSGADWCCWHLNKKGKVFYCAEYDTMLIRKKNGQPLKCADCIFKREQNILDGIYII